MIIQLPYGSVPLKTNLLKFEANDERIKNEMSYMIKVVLISLFIDDDSLISDSFQEEIWKL